MRHRWMVMLVVMITTITTAQEALKQYDGLKAQAQQWATLKLWTGFISAYTPQDESLEAQAETCPASQATVEQASRQDAPAQQECRQIEARFTVSQKREAANVRASVEVSTVIDEHHKDAVEATENAFEHMGEVALLAEPDDTVTEEIRERVTESSEQASPSDDDEVSTVHALREIHLVSRASNSDHAEAAPLAAPDSDAALRKARVASRVEAQAKVRGMRRAIRVMQIQLERATKVELRTDGRDSSVEPSREINTALTPPVITISRTAAYTVAPQDHLTRQASASIGGECAGE